MNKNLNTLPGKKERLDASAKSNKIGRGASLKDHELRLIRSLSIQRLNNLRINNEPARLIETSDNKVS